LVREFALQTWARVETRDDKRVEILRLSEGSASSFRTVLFREVAAQGPAPELADYVRSMFDAPRAEDRRLALASLATFASAEEVYAEWQARRLPHDALDTQGRWMNQLARLPLDQAQQAAASWLAESGWREPRFGPAVARTLGQTTQFDRYLGSFLRNPDVPQLLRAQLAADRAAGSEEARAWLRATVPSSEGLVGVRLVRALGEQVQAEDQEVLAEIAGDPARAGVVRAEAVRYLARVPGGMPTLRRLIAEPPRDFETAEAVVEAAVLSGDAELRAAAILAVSEGFGRSAQQADESEALWRTLWRAQAQDPHRAEAAAILERACVQLARLPEDDPTSPWPDPRALRGEHTSLVEVVQALAATAPARAFQVPELGEGEGPVSRLGMAVWAEAALELAPDAAASISARLAADPQVSRGNRMRALGLAARAARRAGNQNAEVAALERILGLLREDLDEADLVDLGYGLGLSSPRAWLLPLDEVGQRLLLAEARGFESGRGTILGPLLEGGCRVEILLEAGELLAEVESWSAALRFARRAGDFEPSNVRARWQLGRAYEAIDLIDEAREAYQEAVRLSAGDPSTGRIAASRLEALRNR
jgi:tetratricopeptide (TPR) repeat protein